MEVSGGVSSIPPTLPPPVNQEVYDDVTRENVFGRCSVELVAVVNIFVRDERRKNLSGFFEETLYLESILKLINAKRFSKLFCMVQRGRNFGN